MTATRREAAAGVNLAMRAMLAGKRLLRDTPNNTGARTTCEEECVFCLALLTYQGKSEWAQTHSKFERSMHTLKKERANCELHSTQHTCTQSTLTHTHLQGRIKERLRVHRHQCACQCLGQQRCGCDGCEGGSSCHHDAEAHLTLRVVIVVSFVII